LKDRALLDRGGRITWGIVPRHNPNPLRAKRSYLGQDRLPVRKEGEKEKKGGEKKSDGFVREVFEAGQKD